MTRSVSYRSVLILAFICAIFLPFQEVFGQVGTPASIGVFEPVEIAPGAVVEIPIHVENVEDLFAIDLEMTFDPTVLSAQDADPALPGVQMGLGSFLDPGLLLYNTVDNERGIIRFVMSQINPSEPKSGSGILLVVYFKGVQTGETDLTITNLQTSNHQGIEIQSSPVNSRITVASDAPEIASTPIPVVNPTSVILIPTIAPSPTPQPTATPTSTAQAGETVPPSATAPLSPESLVSSEPSPSPARPGGGDSGSTGESAKAAPPANEAGNAETQEAGFFLLDHWWIVALAVMLVAGLGVYLHRTKTL